MDAGRRRDDFGCLHKFVFNGDVIWSENNKLHAELYTIVKRCFFYFSSSEINPNAGYEIFAYLSSEGTFKFRQLLVRFQIARTCSQITISHSTLYCVRRLFSYRYLF